MSRLTNYGENLFADFIRGQGLTLPADFQVALLTACDDSSYTEASYADYARQTVTRSLANWAGTQGAGTTLVSSGTSHQTSNNTLIDFGTVGVGGSATITHVGLFVDATNMLCYAPLDTPLAVSEGDPVSFPAGSITFALGATGGMSDYLSNRWIDLVWRAQTYAFPTAMHARLFTSAPTNAGGGTEVSGGSYARASISSTLAAWSGTQGPGTTTASTGTGGRISNNGALVFPAPTGVWGVVTHMGLNDAASGGNLLFWRALTVPKTVNAGGPAPRFDADALGVTFS